MLKITIIYSVIVIKKSISQLADGFFYEYKIVS